MNEERWQKMDRIFHDVLECAPHERGPLLDRACAHDPSLRVEIEALIRSHDEASGFLQTPVPSLAGQVFGSYQVQGRIDSGGMGDVYRAHDSKLKRDVAIKALPAEFSRDAERVSRFRREAEILASLNHPHIAAIYDFVEFEDSRFLILELVEGETLAERIARGPIPVNQALPMAKQIANAVEAAHEKGVIHRDLKPANIKITADGSVKVLDFGLAKVLGPGSSNSNLSASGIILGTAAYMSPEQASGKETDRTSDVWAFGCVLYEMITGHRVFAGESVTEILSGVLKDEPNWSLVPDGTPEPILRLLRRCLQKNRTLRLHDIADARLEIEEAQSKPDGEDGKTKSTSRFRERLAWISLLLIVVIAAFLGIRFFGSSPSTSETRWTFDAKPTRIPHALQISPDGRKIVFEYLSDGQSSLWLRSLDTGEEHRLEGTESVQSYGPFWSPDSHSIAFFTSPDFKLKIIDLDTGSVRTLAVSLATPVSGTWNRDGVILVTDGGNIVRTSAHGGQPTPLVKPGPGQGYLWFPQFLPDDRHFLYFAGNGAARGMWISDLDGTAPQRVIDVDSAATYASGQLFFVRGQTLFAQKFDPVRRKLDGDEFRVADGLAHSLSARAAFSVSGAGSLVYRTGPAGFHGQLMWLDRSGHEIGKVGEPVTSINGFSLSPDGRTLALGRADKGNADIWLFDMERGVSTRFTTDPGSEEYPVWSPSGRCIVFDSARSGHDTTDLYMKSVTGGGSEELLLDAPFSQFATDISSDGRLLLYVNTTGNGGSDLWGLPVDENCKRTGEPRPLVQTEFHERPGGFSPDGQWLVYQSDLAGAYASYVRLVAGGLVTKLSPDWAVQPRWSHDGHELFYIASDGRLMSIKVRTTSNAIQMAAPAALFHPHLSGVSSSYIHGYIVSSDNQKFLVNRELLFTDPITLVMNWSPKP